MRAIPAFLLGVVVGAIFFSKDHIRVVPGPEEKVARAPSAPAAQVRGDGTVDVIFEDGAVARSAPGVVLQDPAVLLVRFADFARSERAYWISANGLRHVIDRAVAIDLELGLIAFAVDDGSIDGLILAPGQGSLYLGLDVALIGPQERQSGFIDSAAVELGQNDYRYLVQSDATIESSLFAVTLPDTEEMVGLADRAADDMPLFAMDTGTLRDFLERPRGQSVQTMAGITDAVFGQPGGLAREFDDLTRTGRWAAALERARDIAKTAPHLLTRQRRASVYESMLREARALVTTGQQDNALSTLLTNMRQFGADQRVVELLFNIEASRTSTLDAIDLIRQLENTGVSVPAGATQAVLRQGIERYLSSTERSDSRATQLLFDALRTDRDHAPFHRRLGRLLFDAGRYAEAEYHLLRAVELDPAYAADVARELDTARQRRQITQQIEVPILGSGSGLYVNVQLNGSDQMFRFLVDTGASFSAINTSTLLRLGLSEIFANGAPPIELETANGRVFAQSFRLDSMNVAGAVVESVPVVLLEDMGPLDGLLGLSFLRHFDVEINQQDRLLILKPR